jgi:uncharacterized protein YcgL (UPF0745 family)
MTAFPGVGFPTQSWLFPGYRPADMHAYVYKSQLKPDTYVYVPRRDDFSALPAPLLTSLGTLAFVLDVALDAQRRLAQADPEKVRSEMSERGFYLQVPPSVASLMPRHYD